MSSIYKNFPITTKEYEKLEKEFSNLCYHASWQLIRRNCNNNHQCDLDDFQQELMIAALRAGSYYKRQIFLDTCFSELSEAKMDDVSKLVLSELIDLWDKRTKHGANRQKFGDYQEAILEKLCRAYLKNNNIPPKDRELKFDSKFFRYCKQIVWNAQRNLGKRITREKPLRGGQVSLSDHDYLVYGG